MSRKKKTKKKPKWATKSIIPDFRVLKEDQRILATLRELWGSKKIPQELYDLCRSVKPVAPVPSGTDETFENIEAGCRSFCSRCGMVYQPGDLILCISSPREIREACIRCKGPLNNRPGGVLD